MSLLQTLEILENVRITAQDPKLLTLTVPKYSGCDVLQTIDSIHCPQFITITLEANHFWDVISQCFKGNELLTMMDNIMNTKRKQYKAPYCYLQYESQQTKHIKQTQSAMYELANKCWNVIESQKQIEIPKLRKQAIDTLSQCPIKYLNEMNISSQNIKLIMDVKKKNINHTLQEIHQYLMNQWNDKHAQTLSNKLGNLLKVLNIDSNDDNNNNLEPLLSTPTNKKRKGKKRKRDDDEPVIHTINTNTNNNNNNNNIKDVLPKIDMDFGLDSNDHHLNKKQKKKKCKRPEFHKQQSSSTMNNIDDHSHVYNLYANGDGNTHQSVEYDVNNADNSNNCNISDEIFDISQFQIANDNVNGDNTYYLPQAMNIMSEHDSELEIISKQQSSNIDNILQTEQQQKQQEQEQEKQEKQQKQQKQHEMKRKKKKKNKKNKKKKKIKKKKKEKEDSKFGHFSNLGLAKLVNAMHANSEVINTLSTLSMDNMDGMDEMDEMDEETDDSVINIDSFNMFNWIGMEEKEKEKEKETEKEKEEEDDIKIDKKDWFIFEQAINEQDNGKKYYSMFMCYDADIGTNILLSDDKDEMMILSPPNKRRKIINDINYDLDDWWNNWNEIKFNLTQYRDPGICKCPSIYNLKYKKTCYPAPPVFISWNISPKTAPYPYLVKECLTTIIDSRFVKKALIPFWNQKCVLTSRPNLNCDNKYKQATVRLHEVFKINKKEGNELKKWCKECKIDDINITDLNEDILNIEIPDKLKEYCPFTIGDIYLGAKNDNNSPRKYLKFDMDNMNDLYFMNNCHDVLNGEQLANMHIATYGARTPWHHDLGLCSWLQLLYGEKNIKIWDVYSSKLIEQFKNNKDLTEEEKKINIAKIHPKWEIFLRPGIVLYLPAGSGHLVTTTSNCAIMVCGSFIPLNHVRIGYEMAKYEDKGYLKSQDLDWDKIIKKLTQNVFKSVNSEKINIMQRLKHLELNTEQNNWNVNYMTIDIDDHLLVQEIDNDLNNLQIDYDHDIMQLNIIENDINNLMENIDEKQEKQENPKQYICHYTNCKYGSKNKYDFKRHCRSHTGDKPYECNICNKRFIQKSDLNRHCRIHNGYKPFKCKQCNKSFTTSSANIVHQRNHNGIKPYQCILCNTKFKSYAHIDYHINHKHQYNDKCKRKQFIKTNYDNK